MKVQIITLFPDMFTGVVHSSMLWKAADKGIVQYTVISLRDYGMGPRKMVDDTPYGGGDGMLLKPEPAVLAIQQAKAADPSAVVYLPTPRGEQLKQSTVNTIASNGQGLIVFCPRYEGYDERITHWVDVQYSIGNYVLTGGELPAMVLVDSVVRLLPGVLGGETSVEVESFHNDDITIEYPQYTRPEEFKGMRVPDVLLSGHHGQIATWRRQQSSEITRLRRHR